MPPWRGALPSGSSCPGLRPTLNPRGFGNADRAARTLQPDHSGHQPAERVGLRGLAQDTARRIKGVKIHDGISPHRAPISDHNRLRNALAKAVSSSLGPQCHRRSSRAHSWRFARHYQAACRVLSSTAAWTLCACTCPRDLLRFLVSIAFTKLFHFFIAARFSGM